MDSDKNSLIIAPEGIGGGSVFQVGLTSGPKNFLVSGSKVFLVEKVELPVSVLVNEHLSSKISVYLVTPFDSLFLLVPWLLKKRSSFCTLEDILQESPLRFLELDIKSYNTDRICDAKIFEGQEYLRISQEKFREWLNKKYEVICKSVSLNVPWARGTYDNDVPSKICLGILIEFLDKDIVLDIYSNFTLELINNVGRLLNKRGPDSDIRNFVVKKTEKKETKKTPRAKSEPQKLTKNQTQLTNFFTKTNK